MPKVLQMGISWEYDNHLLLSSSKEIAKILQCWEFFVWTPLLSEACELTQSHSINGSPGLDRLPDRLRRQWRYLVQTFLKWYRDDLLCLVCTDKSKASVLALLVLPSQFAKFARKTSSSLPQFAFPAIFSAIFKQWLLTTKVSCSLLQLSLTHLGSMFESTAELNYLGQPKVALGSAHVKFDVWTGP